MNKATLKYLLKIMLIPPNLRLQAGKLPHSINLSIVMLIGSMTMTLQLNSLQVRCGVHLMSSTELVVADDLGVRDALPARGAEEMLGLDARVAEKVVVGYHGEEVGGGHGFPAWLADVCVVDEESGCEDLAEAVPVLSRSEDDLI
jgi:hypothetical protein